MKRYTILLLFVCLLVNRMTSQTILPSSVPSLSVCDSNLVSLTILNTGNEEMADISLQAQLPNCLTYLPGSVINGLETNIADLQAPVFSLEALPTGSSVELQFGQVASCGCIPSINDGDLFTLDFNLESSLGNTTATTEPFEIETALLVVTDIETPFLSGSRGDLLTRTITIRNTRPGQLTTFQFRDAYQAGIEVSSNNGTLLAANSNDYLLEFGAADFALVGDGDPFFELDEELIITEQILITGCGYAPGSAASTLEVFWGCEAALCQTNSQIAIVQILPNTLNPQLEFSVNTTSPTCFCGTEPYTQSLTITNTGNDLAQAIHIELEEQNPFVGIDPLSLSIDSAGLAIPFDLDPGQEASFATGCDLSGNYLMDLEVTLAALEVGASVTLSWNTFYCFPECVRPAHAWYYSYSYLKTCPPEPLVALDSIEVITPINNLSSQLDFPAAVVDGDTVFFDYLLNSSLLLTETSQMLLELEIPCGYSLASSNWNLGNNAPTDITIDPDTSSTRIILEYTLPFSEDSVHLLLPLVFSCDSLCGPEALCQEELFSSCSSFGCLVDQLPNLSINVVASILSCPGGDNCGPMTCASGGPSYSCPVDSVCIDSVAGFYDYSFTFSRLNFGLPDNDDDRFPDGAGSLNFAEVRSDRAIAGDTLLAEWKGVILTDLPDTSFNAATLSIAFAAPNLVPLINGDLLTPEGLSLLAAEWRIWDASSNTTFSCPASSTTFADNGSYEMRFQLQTGNSNPCNFPPGFVLEPGDSLFLNSTYQINYNPLKQSPADFNPVIIQLNAQGAGVVYNDSLAIGIPLADQSCGCHFDQVQLSGFETQFFPGLFGLLPCDTSELKGGSFFEIKLGAANFFPFEYRPLVQLPTWRNILPPSVELAEIWINTLSLQGGQTLKSDTLWQATVDNNAWSFDFSTCQEPWLDEGFFLLIQYRFLSDCAAAANETLFMEADLEWRSGLPEYATPDTLFANGVSLRPLQANLDLDSPQFFYTSFDNKARWILEISNDLSIVASQNSGAAPNVFLHPLSASGLLSDFALVALPSGTPIPLEQGLFQLGAIDTNAVQLYELIALNESCTTENLELTLGWNCTPYAPNGPSACFTEAYTFSALSPDGELDMLVTGPDSCATLCDTVPYQTIEIFNADFGAICNLLLEVNLEPGFTYLPGSTELAYPAGSGFSPFADPTDLGNGTLQWPLGQWQDSLAENCLRGVGLEPYNRIQLRFRGLTDCDFTAFSELTFRASGEQNCGTPSNAITRISEPICIDLDANVGATFFNVNLEEPIVCSDTAQINVAFLADGESLATDSITCLLPPGIQYVAGSLNPVQNWQPGEPLVEEVFGQQQLTWGVPANVPAFELFSFQFLLSGFAEWPCSSEPMQVRTTSQANAECATDGSICSIAIETGDTELLLIVERPEYKLNDLQGQITLSGNNAILNYQGNVENMGPGVQQATFLDLFWDLDQNGTWSPSDSLLQTNTLPPVNDPFNFSGTVTLPEGASICDLFWLVDSTKHCVCGPTIQFFESPILYLTNTNLDLCPGDLQPLDLCLLPLDSYQWPVGGPLSCVDCCDPLVGGENSGSEPLSYSLTLLGSTEAGCQVQFPVQINILPEPGLAFADESICQGETANLLATPGQDYQWSGPGVVPGQNAQSVQPGMSSLYTVTVTDENGCIGADSVFVQVQALPTVNAGMDTTYCPEAFWQLSGFAPEADYVEWSPANLLADANALTPEVLVGIDTTYFLLAQDEFGCQNVDSVNLAFGSSPTLAGPAELLLCLGSVDTVSFSGAQYFLWAGSEPFACLNAACSLVEIAPAVSTSYEIIGQNAEGCEANWSLSVTVIDDNLTTEEDWQICEGESVDIFGTLQSEAGLYCDTTILASGCLMIDCIDLEALVLPAGTFLQDTICPGEAYLFQGDTLTEAGLYQQTLEGTNGCDSLVQLALTIAPITPLEINPMDTSIFVGEQVTLLVTEAFVMYTWQPESDLSCTDCFNPITSPTQSTEYEVRVVDGFGCEQRGVSQVEVILDCPFEGVEIPNVFTPDGDGLNDTFLPLLPNELLQIQSIRVWDRFGELVFSGDGTTGGWPGNKNGVPLPIDVYAFIIKLSCDGVVETISGEITLLR